MNQIALKELCYLTMGQSPSSDNYNDEQVGYPFYQGNADFGKLHPCTRMWCDKPKKLAKKDDILISVRAPIGALNIATEDCCIGRGLAAITVNPSKSNMLYIFYALTAYNKLLQNQGTGSTFKAINKNSLEELLLPDYSIEKQAEIAHVLQKVDQLIDIRSEQLSKLDELVKSRFIEMFGDLRINSKGWDKKPLGKLCHIYRGGSPRPIIQFLGGTIPWIKIGDATSGDNIYLHSTKEHILLSGVKKSRLVKKGSIIFANCGVSLGFARIITFDGCIHDGWLSFEDLDSRLDKVFLLLSLNHMTDYFRSIAPDGTQPNLNTAIMKKYEQIIPPLELQKEFVRFVKSTDKSKTAIQKSLDDLETLKKSLMQQYFA